jgi:GrpB-like predicted nucleotidyltransferase (UPF0157 family)
MLVVDYDPAWPGLFEALKAAIWDAVADIAVAVEHVGSTSVPGLAAKPVIDIDVVVAERDVSRGIGRLTGLGYVHRGDLGIPLREAFSRPAGTVPHNLYLCPSNSPALANHLALRDHLRANVEAAQAYGDLKRRLAVECYGDVDAYVEGKTGFVVSILRQAGFAEASLSDIEAMNRKQRDSAV